MIESHAWDHYAVQFNCNGEIESAQQSWFWVNLFVCRLSLSRIFNLTILKRSSFWLVREESYSWVDGVLNWNLTSFRRDTNQSTILCDDSWFAIPLDIQKLANEILTLTKNDRFQLIYVWHYRMRIDFTEPSSWQEDTGI